MQNYYELTVSMKCILQYFMLKLLLDRFYRSQTNIGYVKPNPVETVPK